LVVTDGADFCSGEATVAAHVFDYALSVSPSDQTILAGTDAEYVVSASLVAGSSMTGVPDIGLEQAISPDPTMARVLRGTPTSSATAMASTAATSVALTAAARSSAMSTSTATLAAARSSASLHFIGSGPDTGSFQSTP